MGGIHGTTARTLSFGYANRHVSITLTHYVSDEQVHAVGASARRATRYEKRVKRPVDIVGSAILLLLTAPLMLAVSMGVRVTMGSPVIFRQVRLTRGGRHFTMYKFRSMLPEWAVHDDVAGPSGFHAADDSLRHTPFGRFIRRFALDELPQLWNVLKGDMSLVGPRPELPEVAAAFDLIDHPRHLVRSGMTGAWQVSENRDGFVHLNVEIDEEYVGDLTFRRDVTIVLRTFAVLVGGTPRNQPDESNDAAAPAVVSLIRSRDAPSCRSEGSDSGSQTVAVVGANPDAADATDMPPAIGIRLLHVLEPRIAGVPAYVDALGRALANRGVEQHVLAAAADGGPGIQLWPFDAWADSLTHRRWSRRPVDAYRIAAEIRRLIASKGIDLVHAHATFAGIAARIRHLDVPLIYQPHGWGHLSTQTAVGARIVRLVERMLDPRTDLLLTLSTHEGHDAPAGRSSTQVRPVVDLTTFEYLDDEERLQIRAAQGWAACERVHLCVGELSHRKNQVALARCWRDSAPAGNRLVFVGDGPERAGVEREGASRVDVVGWRRDIARLMGAADTLVVASRGEGFSLVILEAMATGLPVFTTDVGGSEAVSLNMGAVCGSVREVVAAATTSTLPDGPSVERAHRAQLTHAEWSVDKAADEFLAIFRSARAKRDASPVGSRRARTGVTNGISPTTSPSTTSTADHGNGSSESPNMPQWPATSRLPAPNGVMPSARATRPWNWRRKPGSEPLNGAPIGKAPPSSATIEQPMRSGSATIPTTGRSSNLENPSRARSLAPDRSDDGAAVRRFTRRTRTSRGWLPAVAAQGTASITNFAAAALALSSGTLADFGRFSIAYQLGLTVVSIGEASTGAAALIQGSREFADAKGHSISDGTAGAALVLGATTAVPIAIAGALIGGPLGLSLLLVALGTPGLVSQYTLRQLRFARQDQLGVLRADLIWLAVVVGAALVDGLSSWRGTPTAYLAIWLAGGTISAAPLILVGVVRGRRQLGTFWQATGPQAVRFGFAGLLSRSVFVVPLIATGVIVGTAASGALAAAVLAFSPLSVANTAAGSIVVPRQIGAFGVHVVDKLVPLRMIAAVSALTLAWAACLLALDASGLPSGPFALSANGITAALFTATLFRFLGLAFLRGPAAGLMIADASAETLETRIVGTLAIWLATVVGLQLAGLEGGAFGLAVATWFGAWVTWRRYRALPRHLLRVAKQPLGGAGAAVLSSADH